MMITHVCCQLASCSSSSAAEPPPCQQQLKRSDEVDEDTQQPARAAEAQHETGSLQPQICCSGHDVMM